MLEEIFNVRRERLITNTVRKLPVTAVVPFIKIVSSEIMLVESLLMIFVAHRYNALSAHKGPTVDCLDTFSITLSHGVFINSELVISFMA